MKFYQQINKYMEEADIERLAKQDSREEYEDELDKKEAYKASLMRSDEPEDGTPTMAYMGDYKNVIPLADIEGFIRRIESDINRGVEYISAFVKREEVGDTEITWYYTLKPKEGFDPALIVKP